VLANSFGWSGGKPFASVLTHDVEGRFGLGKVTTYAGVRRILDLGWIPVIAMLLLARRHSCDSNIPHFGFL
jgi:hypothetical protein